MNSSISHYKRDVCLVMLLWLVIVLLYATMKLNGLKTLLSVAVNFVVFLIFVQLDVMLNLTHFFGCLQRQLLFLRFFRFGL